MSRSKSAFLNLVSNLGLQLATSIFGLLVPVLIISNYGSSINGIVTSIKQFVAYLSLVESGIGVASIVALYKPLANKDKENINVILSETKHFYNRSGYFFIAFSILLAFTYPYILHGEISQEKSILLVVILSFNMIIDFFILGKYRVLLIADQKMYIVNLAQVIGLVIYTLCSILFINLDFDIIIVLLISNLTYLLRYFIILIYVKTNYPYIRFTKYNKTVYTKQKWSALTHQISGLIVNNTPLILATILCGFKEVSVLSIHLLISNSVVLLVSIFSNSFTSSFGQLYALDENLKVKEQFSIFEIGYFIFQFIITTCTAVLFIPFIKIYTKGITDALYVRPLLVFLLIIVITFNVSRIPYLTIVNAAGHYKETKNKAIIEAILNLFFSIVFGIIFGLNGILIGSVISYGYRLIDFIFYANHNILKQVSLISFKRFLRFVLFQLIAIILLNKLISYLIINSFLSWFFISILVFFFLSLYFFFINRFFERKAINSLLIKVKQIARI